MSPSPSLTPLELFEKHQGLVYTVLKKMTARTYAKKNGLEFEDVEQEAFKGLWLAACRYREDGGASFSRFAWLTIQGTVLEYVSRYNYGGTKAAACNFSHRDKCKSLYRKNDKGEIEQVDFPAPHDTFDEACKREAIDALNDALSNLQPDRSFAIREHFLKFRILRDIAEEVGCSKERVRQRSDLGLEDLKRNRNLVALAAD